MKATIGLTVLVLLLAVPAHAQNADEARSGRPDRQRQFQRGPDGTRFRGGDMRLEDRGGYGQPPRARRGVADEDDGLRPNRGQDVCPMCGASRRSGQGTQRDPQRRGWAPQGTGRGASPGWRFDEREGPPGPPPAQWNGTGYRRGPQGQPGVGPRNRGFGGPPWMQDDNRANDPASGDRE